MSDEHAGNSLFGLVAQFDEPEALLEAAKKVGAAGYRHAEAYSPFPIDGLAEAFGFHRTPIPKLAALGAAIVGGGGFFMMWFANVIHLPWNIGGRPMNSWPAFIPITFEMCVLGASVTAVFSMLILNRLPQPAHPMFNVDAFRSASIDRFFLCIESDDPRFDPVQTRAFLESLAPGAVMEVPR